ncbi:hypothetical protein [Kribbella sp. CA-293567]|uniref:hypothetical protein n=1 Tax=Kribbella sp. CA-293567 TaxID=3002436 RepID=UPI0022DDAD74|nr:hypothetical protein [Kribbella sp. CA-293567]WBQ03419.1 hypothetical protein OX958_26020 [Kribbella sp. CA-293567]
MKTRALVTAAIVAVAPFVTVSQAHAASPAPDSAAGVTMGVQTTALKIDDTMAQVLDGKAASFTLVAETTNFAQRVRLWRDTSTGNLHGQIAFSKPGDSVWLAGDGCPGSATTCNLAYVPAGGSEANTIPSNGVVDACGRHDFGGSTTSVVCTCIVCKTEPRKAATRPSAAGPAARRTGSTDPSRS